MKYRKPIISLIQGIVIATLGMTAQAGDIADKLEIAMKAETMIRIETTQASILLDTFSNLTTPMFYH